MAMLIQVLTLDSWNAVTRRILAYVEFSWLYWYCYIGVAVFVLMNLVTATIVENAFTSSKKNEDKMLQNIERVKNKELKELQRLFDQMDTDGDGTLSWDEFSEAFKNPDMSRKWRMLDFQPEDCKELFMLLDTVDGNIDTDEFFDGLR